MNTRAATPTSSASASAVGRVLGLVVGLALTVTPLACDSGGGDGLPPRGTEGGPCYANATCNAGLTCLSERCVVYGDGDVTEDDANPGDTSSGDAGTDSSSPSDTTAANDTGTGTDTGSDTGTSDDTGNGGDTRNGGDTGAPPAAPSGLAVSQRNDALVVTWDDNADNEWQYVIERRDDVEVQSFAPLGMLAANVNTYVDNEVLKGIEYTYRVRATNGAGPSGWSNEGALRTDPPTFETDIIPAFERSCGAESNNCHFRNAYAATVDRACRGWLSLENASIGSYTYDEQGNPVNPTGCQDRDLYYRLTQIRAWQCNDGAFVNGNADVVVPGSLEQSFLWGKIEGTWLCPEGDAKSEPMPAEGTLNREDRLLIRQWIVAGAPRDQ